MNSYFLTLVLKDSQTEAARKELLDSLSKKLSGKLNLWGSRDLAYPIKHFTRGFYAHFEFSADPSLAKDLDKTLKVEEDILRYLLVRDDGKIRPIKIEKSVKENSNEEKEKSDGRSGRRTIPKRSETVGSSK